MPPRATRTPAATGPADDRAPANAAPRQPAAESVAADRPRRATVAQRPVDAEESGQAGNAARDSDAPRTRVQPRRAVAGEEAEVATTGAPAQPRVAERAAAGGVPPSAGAPVRPMAARPAIARAASPVRGEPVRGPLGRGAQEIELTPPQGTRPGPVGDAEAREIKGLLETEELDARGLEDALEADGLMSARRILAVGGGFMRSHSSHSSEFEGAFAHLTGRLHRQGCPQDAAFVQQCRDLVSVVKARQAESMRIRTRAAGVDAVFEGGGGGGGAGNAPRPERGPDRDERPEAAKDRDRRTLDGLDKCVELQRHERPVAQNARPDDRDTLIAFDALTHVPPRAPDPKAMSLGNDAAPGTGYRHAPRKKFKHKRNTARECGAYLRAYFTATAFGGAFEAGADIRARPCDRRSGVRPPLDETRPDAEQSDVVLVAAYPAIMDLVDDALRRGEDNRLTAYHMKTYVDTLIADTVESLREGTTTVTAALHSALDRRMYSSLAAAQKRRRRDSSDDSDSESSEESSDDSDASDASVKKRGKAKAKTRKAKKAKGAGKALSKGKKALGVCVYWAAHHFDKKKKACPYGAKTCRYPHKFKGTGHEKECRKQLKD